MSSASPEPTDNRVADIAQRIFSFVVIMFVTFGAAGVGAQYEPGEWYASLTRPALTPPNEAFGPIWGVFYTLMGIAGWLVWQRTTWPENRRAVACYAGQLALNALWSYLFFGCHEPAWALVDAVALCLAILVTLVVFRRLSRAAGWLLAAYLAWATFAVYLNAGFWWLNR